MASVWYVGRADTRTISPTEWIAAGTFGQLFTWGPENGYSIPMGSFSPEQLAVMDTDDDFSINAPSGPRPDPRDPYEIQVIVNTAQVEEFILSELGDPASAISNLLREIDAIQDINDPLTAAMIAALAGKADLTGASLVTPIIDSPTFMGTPTGLSKIHVGLGNVDDTTDAAKPVSTAQAAALLAKADLVGGVIPTSQIPALSLTSAVAVGSQAAMLALTSAQVQPGDIAIRTDGAGTFILQATPASTLANWALLRTPTDVVVSVNGLTGAVTLGKSNIGLGNVDNTADADKPVSTPQATALNLKADAAATATALSQKADAAAVATALSGKADLVAGHVPLSQIPNDIPVNSLVTAAIAAAVSAGGGGGGGTAPVPIATITNWAYNASGLGASAFINDPGGNQVATATIVSTGSPDGAGAHRISTGGSSHSGVVTPVAERFPVVQGDTVNVSFDVTNAEAANRAYWPGIRWYASDKTTPVDVLVQGSEVVIGPGATTRLSISAVAPAGAVYAAMDMRRASGTNSATGDVFFLDRLFYGVNLPAGFNPATNWFHGGSTSAGVFVYAFTGAANASPSTRVEMSSAAATTWSGNKRIISIIPSPAATTLQLNGIAITAGGTATAATLATTTLQTILRRIEYLVTTAAATAIAFFRTGNQGFLLQGDGTLPGVGGYKCWLRWGPATGVATATQRAFAGLQAGIASPTDVEPSSRFNIIGMGWDAADTNIQLITNSASGAATKVDLGSNFPVPTTDRTNAYEIELYAPANGTTIDWKITNLNTGLVANGTASTNLPTPTTLLGPMAAVSAGGTSSVQGLALASFYAEVNN